MNGDKVTYETDGTNQIYYSYDSTGKLLSMNLNGTEYYYIKNAQDDIIGLIDKAGTQVTSYTYDTYGKVISIDGSLKDTAHKINPYRYREYRYDSETGLYYLQSRYYNAEWGRFVNADVITAVTGDILSTNMYAYCKNNFINMSDVNGDFSMANIGAMIGTMIGTMMVDGIRSMMSSITGKINKAIDKHPYKTTVIQSTVDVTAGYKYNKIRTSRVFKTVRPVELTVYEELPFNKVLKFMGNKVGMLSAGLTVRSLILDYERNSGQKVVTAMLIDIGGFAATYYAGDLIGRATTPLIEVNPPAGIAATVVLVGASSVGIGIFTSKAKEYFSVN
ncbi:RHS repeat-associated protein [Clostridium acetobutylicum]|nr:MULTISPECIES: RHS repeat-associated core domain-containing protein [Clostridium]NOV89872.1 RHS repeat-associated protein [Clostridium acetobutylicum]NOW15599.1 RHS repeat-associated protein [Clostridium acetobutylicum]NRY57278.1 RHS repeat-associated protein [Clostridium acetobutylicum]NSA94024.1 RHS repeat-associated protein [Clostridium acetobutylicum]NYC95161.1 RHS repeat-associated protein [Clostridium acetobutylicum]